MKQGLLKGLAWLLIAVMVCGMFTSCKDDTATGNNTGLQDNGNVLTAPAEEGTEAELTAVRDNLVKATETQGFGEIEKMELYENGVRIAGDEYVQVRDNKKFYYSGDTKRLVNYADGYMVDIPADWQPDFSLSSIRSRFTADGMTMDVYNDSEIRNVYSYLGTGDLAGPRGYVKMTFQYINSDAYLTENRVTKVSEDTTVLEDGFERYVLKLVLEECGEGVQNHYTYAVIYNEHSLVMFMFKAVDDRDFADIYESYQFIYQKGMSVDTVTYPEGDNPSWNAQTKELYDSLMNTDHVVWGLFNGNIEEDPLKLDYRVLEKRVDFKFPLVSSYTDTMSAPFDVEGAQKISEDDRFIQFNYHFETGWGNTMGDDAPILDVYRGEYDEYFRTFAKGVVEYGRPMLFRLNNEMNSDWTTWSAINGMLDTDIFVETWIRMYEIFEEEGANEYLIWVWNPQSDRSFPSAGWNDIQLYMPGAAYVDMIGLTAYNFGTESDWGTFDYLYQWLDDYYGKHFGEWGWIISEFGCSDSSENPEHADRKATWIKEMFDCFEQGKYPNIKAAVWFNANDYDGQGNITHEIRLDRDPASIEAFKEGLKRTQ